MADTGAEIPELNGEAVGFRERFDAACVVIIVTFPMWKLTDLGFLAIPPVFLCCKVAVGLGMSSRHVWQCMDIGRR